jgi:hypothetical protein
MFELEPVEFLRRIFEGVRIRRNVLEVVVECGALVDGGVDVFGVGWKQMLLGGVGRRVGVLGGGDVVEVHAEMGL